MRVDTPESWHTACLIFDRDMITSWKECTLYEGYELLYHITMNRRDVTNSTRRQMTLWNL